MRGRLRVSGSRLRSAMPEYDLGAIDEERGIGNIGTTRDGYSPSEMASIEHS